MEAKQRLDCLNNQGASARAFSFKNPFPAPDQEPEEFTAPPFEPCPTG